MVDKNGNERPLDMTGMMNRKRKNKPRKPIIPKPGTVPTNRYKTWCWSAERTLTER